MISLHRWNLIFKNHTNELIHKTETDLQISKTNLWFPKGKGGRGEDKSGGWDGRKHAAIDKTDNQQGPTVWHRELSSILCDDP